MSIAWADALKDDPRWPDGFKEDAEALGDDIEWMDRLKDGEGEE